MSWAQSDAICVGLSLSVCVYAVTVAVGGQGSTSKGWCGAGEAGWMALIWSKHTSIGGTGS